MKTFYFIFFLILMGCNSSQNSNHEQNIIGQWAESENHNVDFIFKKNGVIQYFEDKEIYNYLIKNNNLTIKQEGHLITTYEILLLNKDSLHIKAEEGAIFKLVKRK